MKPKKPLKSGGSGPSLTAAQAAVLAHLTQDFMTVRQIALRRRCSVQAVYQIIGILKKRGVLNTRTKYLENSQCTIKGISPKSGHQVRLHGMEFNIKLVWKNPDYKHQVGKIIHIDGNTIRLYRDSIEVYGNVSFIAEDEHEATAKAMRYWQRQFTVLENDLNVILLKNRVHNITLVKAHYAEINSEMAREAHHSGDRIRIFAQEDGRLWFMIDNSFNFWEAETQHKETAKDDFRKVKKQLNSWRKHDPPTNSELAQLIGNLTEVLDTVVELNKETAAGLNSVVKLMSSGLTPKVVRNGDMSPTDRADYIG